jgi:transcriptional regulator with XRE-family HTH domain
MASRHSRIVEARRLADRDLQAVLADARSAREQAGLTQAQVAAAIGWTRDRVTNVEAARLRHVRVGQLAAYVAAVGLRLRVNAYPDGPSLRDVAQLEVTRRLLARISPRWRRRLEVPLPIPGDRRATDLVLSTSEGSVSVEVFTRLRDAQAQLRATALKWRDSGNDRLVVALAATRTNRAALAAVRDLLADEFPVDTRRVMDALHEGRVPSANGIVLV